MMSLGWRSLPVEKIEGCICAPGDKSISHRAVMLGAIARGETEISGFLASNDCLATVSALENLGVSIFQRGKNCLVVEGQGLSGLNSAGSLLDLGNSGTSMRLLAGILAGQDFVTTLIGDGSLMKRPMRRIAAPLTLMGAKVETSAAGTAPLTIHGARLRAIDYKMPVISAQLKSCLLFAGLYTDGVVKITEKGMNRDHSERMLKSFGIQIHKKSNVLSLAGNQELQACSVEVPGDISSVAFFIVATLIARDGQLRINHVGANPTRVAIIEVLQAMGGKIMVFNHRYAGNEPVVDLWVQSSPLHGVKVPAHLVSIMIDEFPIFFIAAACADGESYAENLSELRVKETDRLLAMENGLRVLGVDCESAGDTMKIRGKNGDAFCGGTVNSENDHRIAMSFAVAALRATDEIKIMDCENVKTSFPNFCELAQVVGMNIEEINA